MHPYRDYTSIQGGDYVSTNSFDYDLFNGTIQAQGKFEKHGIQGTPIYSLESNPTEIESGKYWLDPSSPGYDAGICIPNFNDGYTGEAPDIGAHEGGMPPLEFGTDVSSDVPRDN